MNYKQQLNIIQGLFIPPDTQMRMDCPFCKNLNTLSVDTTENNISWYCFHSTCKARGKKEGEKNMQYVSTTFNKKDKEMKYIIILLLLTSCKTTDINPKFTIIKNILQIQLTNN